MHVDGLVFRIKEIADAIALPVYRLRGGRPWSLGYYTSKKSCIETAIDTAILDVDGTLVDSNYQHALAWFRAFRRLSLTVPIWRIHRAIGMGGDQLVAAVTDDRTESRLGDELRAAWSEEFEPMLGEVQPFEGAADLIREVRRRGLGVVLASSGQQRHLEHYLDLIDGRELADAWTTSGDVKATKPAPDLVQVALAKVDGRMSADERRTLESVTSQILNKLLHLPTVRMKEAAVSSDGAAYADAVRHLFGLDEEKKR